MGYETWIAMGIIALVVGLAMFYVIRAKKKGKRCIGCPGNGCSSCSCHCCTEDQKK